MIFFLNFVTVCFSIKIAIRFDLFSMKEIYQMNKNVFKKFFLSV